MGRAIDLFVTYRFIKLLVTPFKDTPAFKLGIIDENGNRVIPPKPKTGAWDKRPRSLNTTEEKDAYTVLHKLVFNIKKLFGKVPGLRTKLGTYSAALFLLKDTFKESVDDPDVFEREFMKYLKEEGYEIDDTITNDILNSEEEELQAKSGDKVMTFEDESPIDTVLGVEIFPVIHVKTKEKIYVSLEDLDQ